MNLHSKSTYSPDHLFQKPAISETSSFLHVPCPFFALFFYLLWCQSIFLPVPAAVRPSLRPSPHPSTAWCPSFLLFLPRVHLFPSKAAEAEEGWDEDPERHEYREHQAAVVSGVWVGGARPGPNRILGGGGGALLFAFCTLPLLFFFLLFLSLFQSRMWL